jgi:hypothetical protein
MKSVLELEHVVWQAVIDKDATALGEIFSDDYIEVTADGKRVLKESIVENSPQVDEIRSYQISEASTLDLGPDSTLLSYHLVLDGRLRGEPIEPTNRWVVSVWSRRDDRWQCRFFQQTGFDTHV